MVRDDATQQGLNCAGGVQVLVDATGFSVPVGQPAQAGVTVTCTVSLNDVVVPGIPGAITVQAAAWSTLDRYRGRG